MKLRRTYQGLLLSAASFASLSANAYCVYQSTNTFSGGRTCHVAIFGDAQTSCVETSGEEHNGFLLNYGYYGFYSSIALPIGFSATSVKQEYHAGADRYYTVRRSNQCEVLVKAKSDPMTMPVNIPDNLEMKLTGQAVIDFVVFGKLPPNYNVGLSGAEIAAIQAYSLRFKTKLRFP